MLDKNRLFVHNCFIKLQEETNENCFLLKLYKYPFTDTRGRLSLALDSYGTDLAGNDSQWFYMGWKAD